MKKTLITIGVLSLLLLIVSTIWSLDCPKQPEQSRKDWDAEVRLAVAKIGPAKGADLGIKAQNATKDLLGKLPRADRVYIEQMMYAAYCSALRDDKSLTESEKAKRLKQYNSEVRKLLHAHPAETKVKKNTEKNAAAKAPGASPGEELKIMSKKEEQSSIDKQRPNQIMSNSPGGIQAGRDLTIVGTVQRSLSPEQGLKLAQAISKVPSQEIVITRYMSSDDAANYGMEIGNALLAGGWRVRGNAINMAMATAFDSVRGLAILVKDILQVPTRAQQLGQSLADVGLHAPIMADPSLGPDVVLWIGSR